MHFSVVPYPCETQEKSGMEKKKHGAALSVATANGAQKNAAVGRSDVPLARL